MKNHYFAYIAESDGKFYASFNSVRENENFLDVLDRFQLFNPDTGKYMSLKAVNLCETRIQAQQTSEFWNQSFKKNGTYALRW